MNDHLISPSRRPIVIADEVLSTGPSTATVRPDDPELLLREYLRLIRRVRKQQRHRNIALRRADIEALARHLDWTEEHVLVRLADLMGATRRQRATMLAVLATGAALITIASPAAALGDAGDEPPNTDVPIVVTADTLTTASQTLRRPAARLATVDAAVARPLPRTAPILDAVRPPSSQPRLRVDFFAEQAPPAAPEATPPTSAVADLHGSLVAVGEPPVPPTPDVAVGQPPVPPAVDQDGNLVAVGEPPVPPDA